MNGPRVKAFVISLASEPRRAAHAVETAASCPMAAEVVPAVDGRIMTDEELSRVAVRARWRPRYPFALRPGEVGCFLSHVKVWREIVDRGLDAALVLEDDVQLNRPAFDAAVELALRATAQVDVVRLCLVRKRFTATPPEPRLLEPVVVPLGAQAQIITNRAARRLLEIALPMDRPVDTFMQMTWVTGLRVGVVWPSHVFNAAPLLGGTVIQVRRGATASRFRRNLQRPLYRADVRVRSLLRSFGIGGAPVG